MTAKNPTVAEQILLAQAQGHQIKRRRHKKKDQVPELFWAKTQPIEMRNKQVVLVPVDAEGNRNRNMLPVAMLHDVVMKVISKIYERVINDDGMPEARELDTLTKVLERIQKLSYMAYGDDVNTGRSDQGPMRGGDSVSPLFQQIYKIEQAVKVGGDGVNTEDVIDAVEKMNVEAKKIGDNLRSKRSEKPAHKTVDVESTAHQE